MINTKRTSTYNVGARAVMNYSANNQGFTPPHFACVNSADLGLRHTFVQGSHIDSRHDVATVFFKMRPFIPISDFTFLNV